MRFHCGKFLKALLVQTVEYLFEFNESLPKFNAPRCQAGLENILSEKKITM